MLNVNKCDKIFQTIVGFQDVNDTEFRFLFYTHITEYDGGYLLYNTLSSCLVYLTNDEFANRFSDLQIKDFLIKNWFFVANDFNDYAFAKKVNDLYLTVNKICVLPDIKQFTILPTTDCNARCFYCFEKGVKHIYMDEKTAIATAEYIYKHSDKKFVWLNWFGGEPLCNTNAIDTICNILKEKGLKFKSHIVSNGYLFDEKMIKKAKDNWNLVKAQITIDGTEEIYNKIKAYIYKTDESAFKHVIANVENLLKNDINVHIRLNMDEHNSEDLYKLCDYLIDEFKKFNNLTINAHLLFEDSCARTINRDIENRHILEKKHIELQKYIYAKLDNKFYNPYYEKRNYHCMADASNAVLVVPDGRLGKCQHYIDEHFWGSVFNEDINFDEFNWYKQTVAVCDRCEECKFLPMCLYPQSCASMTKRCDEIDELSRKSMLETQMKNMYHNAKEKSK